MRPRSDKPQILIWLEEAGSPEKLCLAALASQRGLTPTLLAEKLNRDQGWVGRWFRRTGNGDGRVLRDVCKALKTSPTAILDFYERELVDLIRASECFAEPQILAENVRERLASCKSETRRNVLREYALRRARQTASITDHMQRLTEDLQRSLATAEDPRVSIARRNEWTEPEDAITACVEALKVLAKRTDFVLPVAVHPKVNPLVGALFVYAEAHSKFTEYRADSCLFDRHGIHRAVENMVSTLAEHGWPQDVLKEAKKKCLKLLASEPGAIP